MYRNTNKYLKVVFSFPHINAVPKIVIVGSIVLIFLSRYSVWYCVLYSPVRTLSPSQQLSQSCEGQKIFFRQLPRERVRGRGSVSFFLMHIPCPTLLRC
jgi:hypothetical protein